MFRKVALFALAGIAAAGLFVGTAGCNPDANIGAGNTPYAARLVPDQSAGAVPSAIAYLKR